MLHVSLFALSLPLALRLTFDVCLTPSKTSEIVAVKMCLRVIVTSLWQFVCVCVCLIFLQVRVCTYIPCDVLSS